MNSNNIKVQQVTSWPTDDIVTLYKEGGWWKEEYQPDALPHLIKGSYAFAMAIDLTQNKAVGMGRVLSDGTSDAYIQDVIVLPTYRNQGIGSKIITFLVQLCLSKDIHWIGLIAEPGSEAFYHRLEFHLMKDHVPMRYTPE